MIPLLLIRNHITFQTPFLELKSILIISILKIFFKTTR